MKVGKKMKVIKEGEEQKKLFHLKGAV